MLKKTKKNKLLSSNLTLKEQNSYIDKDLNKSTFELKKYSFLNKYIEGKENKEIGFFYLSNKKTNEKFELPIIIISTYFLKEIYNILKENDMNRNFTINLKENDEIEIVDILFNNKKIVKNDIFLNKINSFILNSNIFYLFKLNLKTINRKSLLYIFKDKLIYENNRNKETYFYLLKKGDKQNEKHS